MKPKDYMKLCRCCGGTGHVLDGEHARKLRKKAGLTLREVSEQMGVSIVYVSDLERGSRAFNGDTTGSFLKAVGAR